MRTKLSKQIGQRFSALFGREESAGAGDRRSEGLSLECSSSGQPKISSGRSGFGSAFFLAAIATTVMIVTAPPVVSGHSRVHIVMHVSSSSSSSSRAPSHVSAAHSPEEAKERLQEIQAKKEEAHERLKRARELEHKAVEKLNEISKNLHNTNQVLNSNKTKLIDTQNNLVHVDTTLQKTTTQEESMEGQATQRLRQMYEGQRLGLLDMLFQVNSLQQLMDLLYFQERVADMDRQLIACLRTKAATLSAQKNQLGHQKMQLGDIVSEFAKKAFQLNREKSEQEEVADKLRSQRTFYEAAEQQLSRESGQLEQQILAMVRASQSQPDKVVTRGSGNMSLPIQAQISSPFGWRRHPIFGIRKFHTGVDLAGPNHSAIKASDSGNVLYSGWYGGYGKVVIVSHGNGIATLYAHMSKVNASAGQNVHKGDVLGYEGSTGFSTGPHVHFEVRVDGKPNNPLNFVK